MYGKIILNVFLILTLTAVQLSFISGLPGWLNNFNLILVVLIFILGLGNLRLALAWMIGAGLLLDIFSFSPFGVYLISLSLTAVATNFLLTNFFTNRSLYSLLVLIFFSSLVYNFFLAVINYTALLASGREAIFYLGLIFWSAVLKQSVLNALGVLVIFYALNLASKKFKPVFLVKSPASRIKEGL
ncbi:hypothetical protein HY798_00145 [Candidatus Falkowbacteria bacterium]|nr:hypothetical protein [Candidatus Falkowbacteria bacterium]